MFPVDSIKVSFFFFFFLFCPGYLECSSPFVLCTDAHASICNVAGGDVHGNRQCLHANIVDRGSTCIMAWRVVGHHGGWPSACRPLWNVRGGEGADGREPRGKSEPVVVGA
jgi:hypothetical protein